LGSGKKAIEAAMNELNGHMDLAASLLQIGKSTLYRKLRMYEIDVPHRRNSALPGNSVPLKRMRTVSTRRMKWGYCVSESDQNRVDRILFAVHATAERTQQLKRLAEEIVALLGDKTEGPEEAFIILDAVRRTLEATYGMTLVAPIDSKSIGQA
jgi:Bacterial regulatory protein, Fis family